MKNSNKKSMTTKELFESAPIPRAYFALTIPVLGSGLFTLFYNLADTYFVSRTGNTAMVAGVSLCVPMLTIMTALGDIYGLGGSSVISRLFGKSEIEEGGRVCSFSIYAGLFTGLIYSAILFIFRARILALFGVTGETWTYACAYYTVLIFCAPFSVLSTVIGNILRTDAMGTQAFIGQGTGFLLNIILDPVFIFHYHMGATGAAVATLIGKIVTVIILFYMIGIRSQHLSMDYRKISIPALEVGQLFAIGIPASLTNILNSVITALLNQQLLPYGTSAIAAMGIAQKVSMIVMMISACFTFGCQPLLGYCYGSKNEKRLRESIRFDILVQIVLSLILAGGLILFAPSIIKLFMDTPEIVERGSLMLRCLLLATPFGCLNMVFVTLFQSEGKSIPALLMAVLRQGLLFWILLYLLARFAGYHGILLTQLATEVLGLGLALSLYFLTGNSVPENSVK